MRIGLVGCGFTADHYLACLKRYPDLEIVAATDIDDKRAPAFCACHPSIKHVRTLSEMLSEPGIEMILNLASSSSHYEVTKACLEAGKHVYSEKPLAVELCQAKELVALAKANGLYLSVAPCNLLGETAQTLWRAVRNKAIGQIHVVLAELDDGPFHL